MADLVLFYDNHNTYLLKELPSINIEHSRKLKLLFAHRESPTVIYLNMSEPLFICEFGETGKAVAVKNKPVGFFTGYAAW